MYPLLLNLNWVQFLFYFIHWTSWCLSPEIVGWIVLDILYKEVQLLSGLCWINNAKTMHSQQQAASDCIVRQSANMQKRQPCKAGCPSDTKPCYGDSLQITMLSILSRFSWYILAALLATKPQAGGVAAAKHLPNVEKYQYIICKLYVGKAWPYTSRAQLWRLTTTLFILLFSACWTWTTPYIARMTGQSLPLQYVQPEPHEQACTCWQ